jgi:hypothetical protein
MIIYLIKMENFQNSNFFSTTTGILIGSACGILYLRKCKSSTQVDAVANLFFGGLLSLGVGGMSCFALSNKKLSKRLANGCLGSFGSVFIYSSYIYLFIGGI